MSSKVTSISNIKIRDKEQQKLALCDPHKVKLGQKVSPDFEHLVASSWFRKSFHDFFPANKADEAKINITITKKAVTVRTLDGSQQRTLKLSDNAQAKGINQEILRKANKVYRQCQSEHPKTHRTPSPPLRPVSPLTDDLSDSDSDEVQSLRADFEKAKKKAAHLNPEKPQPQFAEKLVRMENNLRSLEKKLGIATPSIPNDQAERIEQLFDRLDTIENALPLLPAEKIDRLRTKKAALEAENAALRARLLPQPAPISREQFTTLRSIYDTLSEPETALQTALPPEQREAFETLPEAERNAIFYHTYLLADPIGADTLWRIGEKTFLSEPGSYAPEPNSLRAEAIRHYLLNSLAAEFARAEGNTPPDYLIARFEALSPVDRQAILTHLRQIRDARESPETTLQAFLDQSPENAPNTQRSEAIHRALIESLAKFHHTRYSEHLAAMSRDFFQETLTRHNATSATIAELTGKLDAATQQLQQAEQKITRLKSERNALQTQSSQAEQQVADLQADIASKENELKALKLTHDAQTQALTQLQTDKDAAQAQFEKQIKDLEANLQSKETDLADVQQQLEALRLTHTAQTQALTQLQIDKDTAQAQFERQIADLEIKLQSKETDLTDVQQQLEALKRTHDAQTQALTQLQTEKDTAQGQFEWQIKDLETKLQSKETDVANVQQQLEALKRTHDAQTQALTQLQTEKDTAQAQFEKQIAGLETNLADSQAENTRLKQAQENSRVELEKLKLEKAEAEDKLNRQLATLQSEVDSKAAKVEELEKQAENLHLQLDEGKDALTKLRTAKEERENTLTAKIEELETEIASQKITKKQSDRNLEQANASLKTLEEQLFQLQTDFSEAEATFEQDIADAAQRVNALQIEVDSGKEQIEQLKSKNTELHTRNEELIDETSQLQREIKEQQRRIHELEKAESNAIKAKELALADLQNAQDNLEDLRKKNQTLLSANIRLKAELAKAKEDVVSLTSECANIERQLSTLRKDHSTLRTTLNTAREDLKQQAESYAHNTDELRALHASKEARLKTQLKELQGKLAEAEHNYYVLEGQKNEIEARCNVTQNSVAFFSEQSERRQQEISRLSEALENLQGEKDNIERELDAALEKLPNATLPIPASLEPQDEYVPDIETAMSQIEQLVSTIQRKEIDIFIPDALLRKIFALNKELLNLDRITFTGGERKVGKLEIEGQEHPISSNYKGPSPNPVHKQLLDVTKKMNSSLNEEKMRTTKYLFAPLSRFCQEFGASSSQLIEKIRTFHEAMNAVLKKQKGNADSHDKILQILRNPKTNNETLSRSDLKELMQKLQEVQLHFAKEFRKLLGNFPAKLLIEARLLAQLTLLDPGSPTKTVTITASQAEQIPTTPPVIYPLELIKALNGFQDNFRSLLELIG